MGIEYGIRWVPCSFVKVKNHLRVVRDRWCPRKTDPAITVDFQISSKNMGAMVKNTKLKNAIANAEATSVIAFLNVIIIMPDHSLAFRINYDRIRLIILRENIWWQKRLYLIWVVCWLITIHVICIENYCSRKATWPLFWRTFVIMIGMKCKTLGAL